jgi:cyclohexyl-isocyanide hydratase
MQIGFLLFDNVTQLDFTGPLQVLSRLPNVTIHLAAKRVAPVETDCGPFIVPTTSLSGCPSLDILCVPGGFGVNEVMQDPESIEFVRHQSNAAIYLSSVCTGAFVLGAAGRLQGRRATTHWRYHEYLAKFGAIPTRSRVVRDGNLFTGGGVTAGIDFALELAREIAGTAAAQAIQLGLEYDPAPPFEMGSPSNTPSSVREVVEQNYTHRIEAFRAVVDKVCLDSA